MGVSTHHLQPCMGATVCRQTTAGAQPPALLRQQSKALQKALRHPLTARSCHGLVTAHVPGPQGQAGPGCSGPLPPSTASHVPGPWQPALNTQQVTGSSPLPACNSSLCHHRQEREEGMELCSSCIMPANHGSPTELEAVASDPHPLGPPQPKLRCYSRR